METLEQILKNHAHRYPKMQPQDAVKLIWQNVFGSGTLRRDPASYCCALMHEFENTQTSAACCPCRRVFFFEMELECFLSQYDLTACIEPSHSEEYHHHYGTG